MKETQEYRGYLLPIGLYWVCCCRGHETSIYKHNVLRLLLPRGMFRVVDHLWSRVPVRSCVHLEELWIIPFFSSLSLPSHPLSPSYHLPSPFLLPLSLLISHFPPPYPSFFSFLFPFLPLDSLPALTCQLNSPWGPMLVILPLLSTNTLSYMGPWCWEEGGRGLDNLLEKLKRPPTSTRWSFRGVLW